MRSVIFAAAMLCAGAAMAGETRIGVDGKPFESTAVLDIYEVDTHKLVEANAMEFDTIQRCLDMQKNYMEHPPNRYGVCRPLTKGE